MAMRIEKISPRCDVYVFDDLPEFLTNVSWIQCPKRVFIFDTFCGTEAMAPLVNRIESLPKDTEVLVINSHFHWDHVFGNQAFKDRKILSLKETRDRLDQVFEAELREHQEFIQGSALKTLPNQTFEGQLDFPEEGMLVFHSPGHTRDSISLFDRVEKILYVGDNLEKPFVYVEEPDLETYLHTLENYLSLEPRVIVGGHNLNLNRGDILNTMTYLQGLKEGRPMVFNTPYENRVHMANLKVLERGNIKKDVE